MEPTVTKVRTWASLWSAAKRRRRSIDVSDDAVLMLAVFSLGIAVGSAAS